MPCNVGFRQKSWGGVVVLVSTQDAL